jgi:hypothetical protein
MARFEGVHLDTAPEQNAARSAAFTPLQPCKPQNQSFGSFACDIEAV